MLNWLFTHTPLLFLTQSLWRDEAFSYLLAKKNIFEIMLFSAKDFSPPLYHLLLHYWLKIFGGSEISLRSLSLIFFWLTLYVSFLFIREIIKLDSKKSFFYLLLFLLNPFLTFYAFESRAYTFFAFLAVLSYYALYKKDYRAYFIATVLGLYTHYFILFVLLHQLLFTYFEYHDGHRFVRIKKIIFRSLLLSVPWFLFVLFTKNLFSTSFWIERTDFKTFLNLLGIIYTGFEKQETWISSLLFFCLAVSYFKIAKDKNLSDRHLYLYLITWGIGIPFFVALISLVKPIFFPRYFIFSTVGFLLLLVFILEKFKIGARLLILIFLLYFSLHFQNLQLRNRKKTDFRKVALEIKTLVKKEDSIYVTNELDFFVAKYYFPEYQVKIFYKTYAEIPDYVGKVLISKNDIAASLPSYPRKAFVLNSYGAYDIQALY